MKSFRESIDPGSEARRARDRISNRAGDNAIVRFDKNKRAELNQWWKKGGEHAEHRPQVKFQPHRIGGQKVEPAHTSEPKTDQDPKPQFSKAQNRLRTAARGRTGMDAGAKAKAEADRAAYVSANRKRFGSIVKDGGANNPGLSATERAEKARVDSIQGNKKRFHGLLGT